MYNTIMTKQAELQNVLDSFSLWITTIKSHNAVNFRDINQLAEGLPAKLLNEIYGLKLEHLSNTQPNLPEIDLGDRIIKIAFQITACFKKHNSFQGQLFSFHSTPSFYWYNEMWQLLVIWGKIYESEYLLLAIRVLQIILT